MPYPICLFAYNRPNHLSRTLEALKNNHLAKDTELYIFCDGPKSLFQSVKLYLQKRRLARKYLLDSFRVREVRRIAKGVTGFKRVHINVNNRNLGLAQSLINGVSKVLQNHEAVIAIEDDIETTPQSLSFLNSAMEHYKKDMSVFSVSAYCPRSVSQSIPDTYPYDTFAFPRVGTWSMGIWRDRWNLVRMEFDFLSYFSNSPDALAQLQKGGSDLYNLNELQKQKKIDSYAIRMCNEAAIRRMNSIYPVRSLITNIGLDYSGTHCSNNPKFKTENLQTDWKPSKFCPGDDVNHEIALAFRSLF